MARKLWFISLIAVLALASATAADEETGTLDLSRFSPRLTNPTKVSAATVGSAKAEVDTLYLMGGPDRLDGKFEDAAGNADWGGWTTWDITFEGTVAWHLSTQRVLDGSYSMVCGVDVEVPGGTNFGYGDNWEKSLQFSQTVPNPDQSVTLGVTAMLRVDSEPTYDYVYLEIHRNGGWEQFNDRAAWDGLQTVNVNLETMVSPEDYMGTGGDQIELRWLFVSDGAASDFDGDYESDGPCWLDNIQVSINGEVAHLEDFEDGTSERWTEVVVSGCGDFAALYRDLQDLDPCRSNNSYQAAFIDDGVVVPGTGGSPCISWCYGPGGYIVNNTGGLRTEDDYVHNAIVSPAFEWVPGNDQVAAIWSAYMHETMAPTSGGIMYLWWVRSTTSADSHDLKFAEWTCNYDVFYGPPIYINHGENLTTNLEPGRQWWQMRLEIWDAGWLFNVHGSDGTPHPYFDNVRVFTWPFTGPAMQYDGLYMAQDNFPEHGDLDLNDLATNSIRFDCARNISPNGHLRNDPGDSLWIDAVPVRQGSHLTQRPNMVVRMKANDIFDGVRTLPPGFTQTDEIIEGTVVGDSTFNAFGNLVEHQYHFDLPDTGFFFPGDVIHYYFEAFDNQSGDIGHTILPGDTSGFASFKYDLKYPSEFICRGLPSLQDEIGSQPNILFWNDFANRGGENEWLWALNGCGLEHGVDYDIYFTNRPDGGEGNGLGGRATSALLDGYDILLYTCGDLPAYALGNGDYASDPSQDLQLLDNWFLRGGKKAFMTGDNLVMDISNKGAEGQSFMNNYLGLQLIGPDVRPLIGNQATPVVHSIPGNGIFVSADRWVAYGGCLYINTFDAVEPLGSGSRLAEFTDNNGNPGAFTYGAAIHHYNDTTDSEVVLLPYDFMNIYNAPGFVPPPDMAGLSARTIMLRDLLQYFGTQLGAPIGVGDNLPAAREFAVRSYPNPFNPQCVIELSMPRAGKASVKIYNVRGELVRTLHDGNLAVGSHDIIWDGRDRAGARSSSGVYFAETKALGETRVTRMAMIK